jgi:hypothetical protein
MYQLMKDRTSFIIAHRLSTIRNADLILVMNEGDIVETDGDYVYVANADGLRVVAVADAEVVAEPVPEPEPEVVAEASTSPAPVRQLRDGLDAELSVDNDSPWTITRDVDELTGTDSVTACVDADTDTAVTLPAPYQDTNFAQLCVRLHRGQVTAFVVMDGLAQFRVLSPSLPIYVIVADFGPPTEWGVTLPRDRTSGLVFLNDPHLLFDEDAGLRHLAVEVLFVGLPEPHIFRFEVAGLHLRLPAGY